MNAGYVIPAGRTSVDKRSLFAEVRKRAPISIKDLSIVFDVSVTTISRLLHELMEEGLIKREAHGESKGGRKPTLFSVDGSHIVAYGVSISRDRLAMILMNLTGKIIRENDIWYDDGTDAEQVIEAVTSFVASPIDTSLMPIGVGISTFGPLDKDNGIILAPRHANIRAWKNVPICRLIARDTGMRVVLENHSRAMALGEQWFGVGRGSASVAHIHADYGIGASRTSPSEPSNESRDFTGVIGNMIIDFRAALGTDSELFGTLEDYASVEAIIREVRRGLQAGRPSTLQGVPLDKPLDFRDIAKACRSDDPLVTEIVGRSAEIFGIGLANYLSIARSEVVVLGGETIESLPGFFETAVATAGKLLARDEISVSRFQRASLSGRINCVGAATRMFEISLQE